MSDDSPRIRLLQAAGAAFAARGIEKPSICRRADVNLVSVHHRFAPATPYNAPQGRREPTSLGKAMGSFS